MTRHAAAIAPAIAAVLLAGCSTPAQGPAVPDAGTRVSRSAIRAPAYTYLYVTDPKVNKLEILDPSYNLVETITSGLNNPVGDFVDASANLYVANESSCSNGNVVEYAHGYTTPTATYSTDLSCPLYVAADSAGDVFVYDYGVGYKNYLYEFKQGGGAPVASWNTCNSGFYAFCYPTGIAMGPPGSGTIFLTMYGALHGSLNSFWVVDELWYQQNSGEQLYVTGYNGPGGGTALDSKQNILVGAYPVPKGGSGGADPQTGSWGIVMTKHKHGSENALKNLKYKSLSFVSALALSANQKTLYVADYGASKLTVLSYPKGKYILSLDGQNGLTDPDGVALGPAP